MNTFSPRTNQSGEGAHASHLAASFTDLMASLMVIFILLFVATLSNAAKKQETVMEFLLGALTSALAKGGLDAGGIKVDDKDPFAVVIVMPEDLLFRRAEWRVGARGQDYLQRMVPILAGIVCEPRMRAGVASVVVEGHTDTTWLGAMPGTETGAQGNLELSQQRSMDVVRGSLSALPVGPQRDCFRGLLSASGRGQEELLPSIPGDDVRQRRVVFKIRTQQDSVGRVAEGLLSVETK